MQKLLLLLLLLPLLVGCSDDDKPTISLEQAEVTLKNGETYQINASSDNKIMYSSENEFHAIVSEAGLVTANKVGETNILLTDGEVTKYVKVIIEPQYDLYTLPSFEFGMSKNDLINKLGTPAGTTADAVIYYNYSDNIADLGFLLDANGNVRSCGIKLKSATKSQIVAYLNERYVYVKSGSSEAHINTLKLADATMMIVLVPDSTGLRIMYIPFGSNKANSEKDLLV